MKQIYFKSIHIRLASLFMVPLLITACQKKLDQKPVQQQEEISASAKHQKEQKDFEQVNLAGNNNEYHPAHIDPNLVNAWGLTFTPTGIAWLSAEGTGLSTIYDKEGAQLRPPVAIPSPTTPTGGAPTGIVFNPTADFKISNGQPARFIFVGTDGVVSGWNPASGNFALRVLNNSATSGYTGLTMANDGSNTFLYAANFKAHRIDVFDKNFAMVPMAFMDPALPSSYSPFNIQVVDGKLYVMYAKVGPTGDEVKHPGFGFVDIYNTNGSLYRRFVSRGQLNAPWGVAHSPANFFADTEQDKSGMKEKDAEDTGDAILIGNFGDGHINAYSKSGRFLGQIREDGKPIAIEGLWAIMFPPATATAIDPNRLYFTAGPDAEMSGLFGYIKKE